MKFHMTKSQEWITTNLDWPIQYTVIEFYLYIYFFVFLQIPFLDKQYSFFNWHYCTLWCIFYPFFSLFCLGRYCIESISSLLSNIILIISSFNFVSFKIFGGRILTCSVFNTYTQFHSDSYSCVFLIDQTHDYISFQISFDIFISLIIQHLLVLLSQSEWISLTNKFADIFSPCNASKIVQSSYLFYFLLRKEWSSGC